MLPESAQPRFFRPPLDDGGLLTDPTLFLPLFGATGCGCSSSDEESPSASSSASSSLDSEPASAEAWAASGSLTSETGVGSAAAS
jgi:hypothetical protein